LLYAALLRCTQLKDLHLMCGAPLGEMEAHWLAVAVATMPRLGSFVISSPEGERQVRWPCAVWMCSSVIRDAR